VNQRELKDRAIWVRERIAEAAWRSGREPEDVEVLPITKGHPTEAIGLVAAAGFPAIGENRVAEAEAKLAVLGRGDLLWHMVGHLQRNKASRALETFDVIESVDSLPLAQRLHGVAERIGLSRIRVLVQVNASGETRKTGLSPGDVVPVVEDLMRLDRLEVDGLMTMAPFMADEAVLRDTFGKTRSCLEACRRELGFTGSTLSMGMSADFEVAVEEGSTEVRLGTVLLGQRGGA
jgi:pyridoxal phosphate enzyme (YggS family)